MEYNLQHYFQSLDDLQYLLDDVIECVVDEFGSTNTPVTASDIAKAVVIGNRLENDFGHIDWTQLRKFPIEKQIDLVKRLIRVS